VPTRAESLVVAAPAPVMAAPAAVVAAPAPSHPRLATAPAAQPRPTSAPERHVQARPDTPAGALAEGLLAPEKGSSRSSGRALEIPRGLAVQLPDDAHVLRAQAESAAVARDWSGAAQAAESWALVDPSAEPRLYLARMLAYAGKPRAAVRILEDLLEAHPECDEARARIRDYATSAPPPPPASSVHAARTEPAAESR
jgi:predicted Zn-dependent protease